MFKYIQILHSSKYFSSVPKHIGDIKVENILIFKHFIFFDKKIELSLIVYLLKIGIAFGTLPVNFYLYGCM